MKGHPTPPRALASGEQPIVYVIDDDKSMRRALTNLFQSVDLRVEVFGSALELLHSKTSGCRKLPSPRHQVAGIERFGLSDRASQGEHSHSDHLYDRSWRYSDDGQGHEGRGDRFLDQTISPPRNAGCRGDGNRTRSEEARR